MSRRLHLIALVLFVLAFLYDVIVWGAVPGLPDVGPEIAGSAAREAPVAATYIALGSPLDGALPSLQRFGERRLQAAFGEGFDRIREDSTVAMDLLFTQTWNAQHRWLKTMYWAPLVLLVLTALLWWRRPRQVRTLGRR
jgi:hypothetical protein